MLSRPSTEITLTPEDIAAYEQRMRARESLRAQEIDTSHNSDKSTVEDAPEPEAEDSSPAAQTRAARSKKAREQRIGVGPSKYQG